MFKKYITLLIAILLLSACSEIDDAAQVIDDVSNLVKDVEEIAQDVSDIIQVVDETVAAIEEVKNPESKKLSSNFNLDGVFPIETFEEDPGLLTFVTDFGEHIANFDETFQVTYNGNMDWDTFEQQLNDINNPLTHVDPYIAGHFLHYTWEAWNNEDGSILVEFTIDYWTDAEKEQQVDAIVEQFVDHYIDGNMSDFEKAKTVNDYVVQLATYTDKGATEGQSAYELVTEGTAVCQAYALLGYRLFEEAGLDADYVYGYSDDELHAWNMVEVDGKWYHVDITWNDVDPAEPYTISYEYFLKSNKQLQEDHLWMPSNYADATSEDYTLMHNMWYADTENDIIYYSNIGDKKLYSYNIQTGEQQLLSESRTYYIAVHDNWVYFSDYDNGGYLTRLHTQTGEKEMLSEEEVLNVNIEDNTLYFETTDGQENSYSL